MNEETTILIVDDSELIRMLVQNILEQEGYKHFIVAKDGVSAYKILKAQKIDLIISDWNMLGMTGIELLIKVRADQEISQIPFIMLSVETLDITIDQAFKSGANDFITKPFNVKDLTDSVARVMGQAH
ncbi:MAG: response regulator [Deltaproteobacteria bacterium HGW-Deltaproteobacteria-7]|jgi:two-component system chemotaxis response regulator CheY|nr:MAG: response regulator [Deltaproteobacteria bacterium HGW-Deltaproteobacteria-7]PKN19819.1 MAG: response regulator [Deltaproteobacteria bacterium HGW-Deltaproteobacteria-6]